MATPNTTSTKTGFVGWHRAGQSDRWRAIVEGENEDSVFQQLLSAIAGGDKCVLPAQVNPNETNTLPRRRRF